MDEFNNVLDQFTQLMNKHHYVYISRDPERSIGLEQVIPNYTSLFYDRSVFIDYFKHNSINYLCLQDHKIINRASAAKLLKLSQTQELLETTNLVQTFKISNRFEKLIPENIKLLNTSAILNRTFEDKISQFEQLSDVISIFPKTKLLALAESSYEEIATELGTHFVLQFGRGHTGLSTFFIKSEADYNELKANFPLRTARMSKLIEGETYTVNCCVTKHGTYLGGLSYQITGVEEIAHSKGATVGNDFSYRNLLTEEMRQQLITEISLIGDTMHKQGYLGLFGVDFMAGVDGKLYFIEINARQPASIPFHTKIQLKQKQIPLQVLHIMAFLENSPQIDPREYSEQNTRPLEFSQVFLRAKQAQVIEKQQPTGSYRLQGDNVALNPITHEKSDTTIFLDEDRDKALLFQKQAHTITDLADGEMLLLTGIKGKQLSRGDEIARLQLQQGAINQDGALHQWIIEGLSAINI